MICFPNAKINLGLNIVRKRPDGYHDIETLFYPIPVKDALEIIENGENDCFHSSGIPVESNPTDNLVIKALHLLRRDYSIPSLEIHLVKGIPTGAGLGGGSSDAAYMLKLLNDFFDLGISVGELENISSSLGADCAFFIRNKPVFATGTGNIFTPVELSLKGYYLGLVKPKVSVSTPEAYSNVVPCIPDRPITEIIKEPVHRWKDLLVNDFERKVFRRYPVIGDIKNKLYDMGAIYAAMSGSGSAVFGLFTEKTSLKDMFPNSFVWEGILT